MGGKRERVDPARGCRSIKSYFVTNTAQQNESTVSTAGGAANQRWESPVASSDPFCCLADDSNAVGGAGASANRMKKGDGDDVSNEKENATAKAHATCVLDGASKDGRRTALSPLSVKDDVAGCSRASDGAEKPRTRLVPPGMVNNSVVSDKYEGETVGASDGAEETGSKRQCAACGTTTTPAWRLAGDGSNTWHCNACELRAKSARKKGVPVRECFEARDIESLERDVRDENQIASRLHELINRQDEGRIGLGRKAFATFAEKIDQHFSLIKTGNVHRPKRLSLGNIADWRKWVQEHVDGVQESDVLSRTMRLLYAVVRTVTGALKKEGLHHAKAVVYHSMCAVLPSSTYYVLKNVVGMKLPPPLGGDTLIGVNLRSGNWSAVLKVKRSPHWDEFPKGYGVSVTGTGHVNFELRAKNRTEALAYREALIDRLLFEGLQSNLDRNIPARNCDVYPSDEEWELAACRVASLFDRISTRSEDALLEDDGDADLDTDELDADAQAGASLEEEGIVPYEQRNYGTRYKTLLTKVASSKQPLYYIAGSSKCAVVGLQSLQLLKTSCHTECRGFIYIHMSPLMYPPSSSRPYSVFANKIGMTQAMVERCTLVDRHIERRLRVRGARIPAARQEHLRDNLTDGASIAVIFSEQNVHFYEQYLREHGEAHLRSVYGQDFEKVRYDGPVSEFYSRTRRHGEQLELHTDYEEARRMNDVFVEAVLREVERLRETALLFHMGTIALRRATRIPKAQVHSVVGNIVARSKLVDDFKD